MRFITYLLLFMSVALFSCQDQQDVWRDSSKSFDERTESLLSQLTVEEKLRYFSSDIPAVERLGIPAFMWYNEALHGLMTWGVTSFPQNNAMGSTWDRDLMFDVASAISDEARALQSAGKNQVMIYSPTVNMARDPRWGRNEECYSEDPYHMSEIAKMYIRGMQGTHPKYLKTVCTVKHYAANNVEHKREQRQSMISERDLREYYLPPYKACIVEERAAGVMSALNGVNDIPSSAHKWLLSTVLRDEWGFEGYVVADWGAVGAIHTLQRKADTNADAAIMALRAGCDQECFRPRESPMVQGLTEAYNEGRISEKELDVALRRLIKLRFMVNGFNLDDECPYNNTPASLMGSDANKALALKAAEKSIVLLKNEKSILPLSKSAKSIAVVGPFADRCWLGIYSGTPKSQISPLKGIQSKFKGEVKYAQGCGVTEDLGNKEMAEAVAAAKGADVVVAFVGNDNSTATENLDRSTLALPGRQQELLEKLCKVNKNVVVVIVPSGSTTIGKAQNMANGIICGWANGQEQGNAIASVLFGDVNPGGKLNTTWFASDDDLEDKNDYNIRNNRTYMYFSGKPLYPFGHGLSYTTFKFSNLKFSSNSVAEGAKLTVTVDVTNTGKVAGDEVVQLYIKNNATKEVEASKILRGFERVTLAAGETKSVTMTLGYDAFSHWSDEKKAFVVAEGDYEVMVGNSSANTPVNATIKVAGGTLPEHSLRTVSYDNYHDNERYRSKYFGGKIIEPVKEEPKATTANKKTWKAPKWIEFLVDFVDPGFYVSEWTVRLNYTSENPNTPAKLEYDGAIVREGITLEKAGKATQEIKIPKPDYDLGTRVRFYVDEEVEIESLEVIWPKDNSVTKYSEPISRR
ncbi:MAG: glycoside hydrolase family 3 C-terminal domain-containing protein [Rikenellaceae bacterium]